MIPKWIPITTIIVVLLGAWLEILFGDRYFNYHTHDMFHRGEVEVLGLITIALIAACVIIGVWKNDVAV